MFVHPLVGFLDCMEAMYGLARTKSSGKKVNGPEVLPPVYEKKIGRP